MTYLAMIRRTLAYALIATTAYTLPLPDMLQMLVSVTVAGLWLLDMSIGLISRVRQ